MQVRLRKPLTVPPRRIPVLRPVCHCDIWLCIATLLPPASIQSSRRGKFEECLDRFKHSNPAGSNEPRSAQSSPGYSAPAPQANSALAAGVGALAGAPIGKALAPKSVAPPPAAFVPQPPATYGTPEYSALIEKVDGAATSMKPSRRVQYPRLTPAIRLRLFGISAGNCYRSNEPEMRMQASNRKGADSKARATYAETSDRLYRCSLRV